MNFRPENIVGIFNPAKGNIVVKGKFCNRRIYPELEIDFAENCIIVLAEAKWLNITVNELVNFVMIKWKKANI